MTSDRELTTYEVEVATAMTARRDAVLRLMAVLEHDVAGYEGGMLGIREGRALEILVPPAAGIARQEVSDVVNDFEAARHRYRLALVALAVENGMTARQIGDSFAFSRQLASRYLKEAKARWPALESPFDHETSADAERADDGAPVDGAMPSSDDGTPAG
jgi:hypothetical protein